MTPDRIGSYPVEREIGRGGMGIVYLGRDLRLGRPVALKVLPDLFARDPERLARFEREARLLASLTHPNIAGIYGLEESEGRRFLALEFVEGETLTERLRRGPILVEETLEIAAQIASALEAAHETGIVHRDLKPGNVKLTPAGQVKVLDFGLAKGAAPGPDSQPDLSQSPTMTVAATGVGVVLGTAAYMSPEQARGKTVDRRTDIWSFGCVLYECLTARQAFAGETTSDMIALILQGEPDWSKLPPNTPEKLRVLLARCLEKDARRRLRDIGDARLEIEELQGVRSPSASQLGRSAVETGAGQRAAPRRSRRFALTAAAALLLVLLGAAAGIAAWSRSPAGRPPAEPLRFTIQAPPGRDLSTDPNDQAISPDGRTIVFVSFDSSGVSSLWARPLGSFNARELPGTRRSYQPFWSPDSRHLGFFAEGKLKRVRLAGGTPTVICDAPSGRGADWSRKNVIVLASNAGGPLFRVPASGGRPERVTAIDSTKGETAHRWPVFLPDGEHFLYAAVPARDGEYACYVGSLASDQRTELLRASNSPRFAAPHHLVYTRNDVLVAQRFDAGGFRLSGEPIVLGDPPAPTTMTAAPCVSVSATGVVCWQSSGSLENELVWIDRAGREVGKVELPPDRWAQKAISPDGRRALLMRLVANGNSDLWVLDLERETTIRLTTGEEKATPGTWSPDGSTVLYQLTRFGARDLFRRAADGSGPEEVFYRSSVPFKNASDWSRDGNWVVVSQTGDSTGWNIFRMPAQGGEPIPYLVTRFQEQNPVLSPNGKWLLYFSDENDDSVPYVQMFPEPGGKQQVAKLSAFFGVWSSDGSEIILIRNDGMAVSVPVTWTPAPRFGTPRDLHRVQPNLVDWTPSPDARRFLITRPLQAQAPGISVAVNWQRTPEP